MLLDSNNCYHIPDYGLFVFFPEIGEVLFYSEKDGKTRIFDEIQFDDAGNIIFVKCVKDSTVKVTGLLSKIKAACKKETDIIFCSEKNDQLFATFFVKERINKQDSLKARKQVDYLLVYKSSAATVHTSLKEVRILRIDWGSSQIKYYGEEETFQINDYKVPKAYDKNNRDNAKCKLRDLQTLPAWKAIPLSKEDLSKEELNTEKIKHYNNYKTQFQLNGMCQFFADEPTQTAIYNYVIANLKASGIFSADAQPDFIERILDMLDSSLLKTNWLHQFNPSNSNFAEYINSLSTMQESSDLKKLIYRPDGDYYKLINDTERIEYIKDKSLSFTINYKSSNASDASDFRNIKFTLDNTKLLDRTTSPCGADNCYFTVNDDRGDLYGLRLSANIYKYENVQLYNLIIENLINAILYSYFNIQFNENLDILKGELIPEITKVLKFGFIKVKFTSIESPGTEIEGFVPYTLTELKTNYITLGNYINELCADEKELKKCDIEGFIKNVLQQVYNFFSIARPYFKFCHNDFKINNILINRDNGKLYIIDFGYAQINFYSDTRIYYLTNRLFFQYDGGESEEYNWYIKNIEETYYSDNDIETLIYWLINIFNKTELTTVNKKLYFDITNKVLNYLNPIKKGDKPMASKDTKTELGLKLYTNPQVKLEGLTLIYRLYQIYSLLRILKDECLIDIKLVGWRHSFYRKYVFGYNQADYLRYQQVLLPLLQATKLQAGGKSHRRNTPIHKRSKHSSKKQTYIQHRKYKTKFNRRKMNNTNNKSKKSHKL